MTLDELRDATDDAADNGAEGSYAVSVSVDGIRYGVERAEVDTDGTFIIYTDR